MADVLDIDDWQEPEESRIVRKPGKFRFRVLGDDKLIEREGLRLFSDIQIEPIEWLWEPYLPLGRITILGGDPGIGKSFISTALAASLSRGDALPGEADNVREPMKTLMFSAEDDPADTIKPRLLNLRADMTKIAVFTEDMILDLDGLKAIREMVIEFKPKLVVIDPIVAFLGPKVDMNRANEVRHIMKGIDRIARELNVAILIVRHNRKSSTSGKETNALHAGNGSIDFTAAVRSELAVNESKNGTKFLNHIKSNNGAKGNSILYSIVSMDDGTGLFRWGEFTVWPPQGAQTSRITITRMRNDSEIRQWLHDVLKDHPDGLPMREVISLGALSGYSQTKLEHMKKGVVVSAKRGMDWVWKLDTSAPVAHDADGVVV